MEELKGFLNIPNLSVNDAAELYSLSKYILNDASRKLIGPNRFISFLSIQELKSINFFNLIDTCYLISKSPMEEFLKEIKIQRNVIETQQNSCFICKGNLRIHSSTEAKLYDDKKGE